MECSILNKKFPKKSFLLPLDIQFFAEEDKGITAESLKKLQEDFSTQWKNLKTLLDTQADEMRKHGETSTATAAKITTTESTIGKLEADLKGITEQFKTLETKMNRPGFGSGEKKEYKTPGELFTESDAYKNMVSQALKSSSPVEVKSFFKMLTKDLDSTDPKGGILVTPQAVPGIFAPVNQQLRMRDLLNVQGTTSNAIEFIEETGFTNAAAPVPEKELKPASTISFDAQTASVKTIAHWMPATRQIIDDATQLRGYVDGRLIYGLKLVEETQLLYGTGTGENLQGIMTHTGIQAAPDLAADETRIDRIRRSITMARLAGYPVTGIILHPTDFSEIELAKGTDGHYIWVTVPAGGGTQLWRVPVVESLAMQENNYLLGAFGLGAQVWDREDANIRVSEHHADYFIRNQIAILAEERLTQTIYRPEAFVKGTFTVAIA
jgi:HK97 family phage major capsid protein